MDVHDKKIYRIINHLKDHPSDYQSRISLFKQQSNKYRAEQNRMKNMGFKKLAEVRKNEECK